MRDVFLCHASEDKKGCVHPLAHELHRHAITYWLDEAEIHWGDSITKKVNEGLSNSRFIMVFFTEHFFDRSFPETELSHAIDREIYSKNTVILPILTVDGDRFKKHYPLLSSKKYMRWDQGPKEIASELVSLLDRPYKKQWRWIYPAGHKGPVWFRLAAHPDDSHSAYQYTLDWGPWQYRSTVDRSDGAVALIHSKSHDGEPVPISLEVDARAYCDIGTGEPPENKTININRG